MIENFYKKLIKVVVPPNQIMKVTKLFAAGSLALLGSVSGNEPVIPFGFLDVSSQLVRAESDVDLTWEVNIPASEVEELIDIPRNGPPIITAKEDVAFEVRMLGVEYAYAGDYVLAFGQYRTDDSPRYTFFWGYGDDANSLSRRTCDILESGEELEFNFRGSKNGFRFMPGEYREWFDMRWSGNGQNNRNDNPAVVLKNGDRLPARVTPPSQVDASSVLASYLDPETNRVNIGPKDLIILAELNRDNGEVGADYQDFVILVTFTEAANSECIRRWNGPTVAPPAPPAPPTTGGGEPEPEPAPEPEPEPRPDVPGLPE